MTRRLSIVLALVGVLVAVATPSALAAGQNNGLCTPKAGRVTIPSDFVLDGCFDGTNLRLRNTTDLPLRVVTAGDAGAPYQSPVGGVPSIPSAVFTYIDPAETGLVMPGYDLRIPIGRGAADVTVDGTRHNRSYLVVKILAEYLPAGDLAKIGQATQQLTSELSEVWTKYQDCRSKQKGFWGRAGCEAAYPGNTAFALGRFTATVAGRVSVGAVKIPLAPIMGLMQSGKWAATSADAVMKLRKGTRTLHIAGSPADGGGTTAGGGGGTPTGGGGGAATGGGSSTPVVDTGGRSETTGGPVHTWTNYRNAGGSEGPTIAAHRTVAISCKLRGFAVANGNTWWYRIAESPWSGAYYASADAFYNNGRTSGSLVGTPYVDTAVRDC